MILIMFVWNAVDLLYAHTQKVAEVDQLTVAIKWKKKCTTHG